MYTRYLSHSLPYSCQASSTVPRMTLVGSVSGRQNYSFDSLDADSLLFDSNSQELIFNETPTAKQPHGNKRL